jgi:hypothetical protein
VQVKLQPTSQTLDYPQERDVFNEIPKDIHKTTLNSQKNMQLIQNLGLFLLHCCEFNARVIKE